VCVRACVRVFLSPRAAVQWTRVQKSVCPCPMQSVVVVLVVVVAALVVVVLVVVVLVVVVPLLTCRGP